MSSPIFWFTLVLVLLILYLIYLTLKKILNTDKTIILFIPAEMLKESERIEDAVKELKDYTIN